jgi:uncharacterized repeat protein (TIGR01451 family)
MRKDLSAIGFAMVLSGVAVFSSFAADPALVSLRGHVPAVVSRGKVKALGDVDANAMMSVSIGLPVRNSEALEHLIQQVSDPSSSVYGHYLTPGEFTERFGPTEEQYQAVIEFARKNNLTITQKHPNRMLLSLRGRTADIEKAFSVKLHRYQHPTEGREFFSPDHEPTVPGSLSVLRIEGLDNFDIPHPSLKRSPVQPSAKSAGVSPKLGSGPGGSYQGTDFRNAYAPGTTLTGNGQNVGLLQFDGFFASDIAAYASQIGLATVPNIIVVPIDGGVPTPTPFGNPEVSLDLEMILSMSPGVGNIYVYEAPNPSPWPDILNRMANDNVAKNLSSSWGGGPPDPVSEQIFQQMAVQGQTFFQASGDSDAYLVGESIPFPSDSPHITVVGGTTLSTTAGAYSSETVWNWGIEFGFDGEGSSGGISPFYSIPFWQTNINFTASQGSSVARNLPDVAMTGDNVWVIFGGGQAGAFGGTSCAAPLWAGFTSLINQQAALNAHAPVGFLNPAIYQIATAPNYTNCFHDIVLENNTWSQSPNLFFAVPGYDLCTGLGSPNGTNLISALLATASGPFHISPPSPPYGTNMSAVTGGNPNGTWSLFIQDDKPLNSGFISNGWVLSLTLADIVGTAGDLQVLISPTNASALIGQPVAFSISVTNYGPSSSTNVTVINDLPTGAVLVSSNATQGTVSKQGTTLVWNVGTLAANTGAGLALTLQPTSAGSLVASATVQAGTPDPNPDDDSALATINSTPVNVTLVPTLTGGGHSLQVGVPGPTGAGLTIVIQASSNLISTNWVNVYTGTPPFNFIDPAASSYVRRYYRAQVLP